MGGVEVVADTIETEFLARGDGELVVGVYRVVELLRLEQVVEVEGAGVLTQCRA